jgi:integrase
VAGRCVSEAFVARGVHWKTANKDVSALSGYWKWLVKRGYLDVNVREKQSLPKVKPRREEERSKRPFTDAEVVTLFRGIGASLLRDAMLIAVLSGLRTEEIAQLRVADCDNGLFSVRIAKTAAGVRDVPIHDDLTALVARRRANKSRVDYLFDKLKDPAPGSAVERGRDQAASDRRRALTPTSPFAPDSCGRAAGYSQVAGLGSARQRS